MPQIPVNLSIIHPAWARLPSRSNWRSVQDFPPYVTHFCSILSLLTSPQQWLENILSPKIAFSPETTTPIFPHQVVPALNGFEVRGRKRLAGRLKRVYRERKSLYCMRSMQMEKEQQAAQQIPYDDFGPSPTRTL